MPSTPRRTPGSQTPAGRASARRSTTAGGGGRPGAARSSRGAADTQTGGLSGLLRGADEQRSTGPRAPASRSRPTRRPGARRTTASSNADRRFNRRSGGRFTGRAAIVAAVVSVLVLTLAYPMQEYLAQRSQIVAAEQEQAEQLARIAGKEERKQKWNDPAHIRAQAGKRFSLVEPGVTVYIIKDDPSNTAGSPGPGGQPAGRQSSKAPWYSQLWSSVEAANRPPAGQTSRK